MAKLSLVKPSSGVGKLGGGGGLTKSIMAKILLHTSLLMAGVKGDGG
jgi:hypothetical protein